MAQSTLYAVRDLAPLIARYADEAERERRLARPVVDALVDAGVFRLLVPPALGGAGASPMEFCEIIEAVSTVDGSTGWCVMIGGGYGHFSGLLPPPAAAEIFRGTRSGRCWHLPAQRGGSARRGRLSGQRTVAVSQRQFPCNVARWRVSHLRR